MSSSPGNLTPGFALRTGKGREGDGFSFGRNWDRFVRENFSEERMEISRRHILDFLGVPDLSGKTFLDIGCGSGIHSLAAYRSGASRGMAFWTDMRDWLGGWPYEPATPGEVADFCEGTHGLKTLKVKTGEANVEYLFTRG